MATFEQGFAAVETAAQAAEAAARKLTAAARKLRKAAQEGNIAHLRRDGGELRNALAAASDQIGGAAASWPFSADQETAYLETHFAEELCGAAASDGLTVMPRDEVLVCSPSIIRVTPAERAVRIDGRKRPAIRPSRLVADLHANRQRRSGFRPQQFLEAMFKAFKIIVGRQSAGTSFADRIVTLDDVYRVFTSLPGSGREYTRTDFARDIYLLDSSDVSTTGSGARVSFPASTGARSTGKTFSFVDPAGNLIAYYGIRFSEQP